MKKENKEESISKLAYRRCKNTWLRKSLVLSLLFVILIAVLALAFFFPVSLFLTVPFIVVPAVFAFQAVNTVLELNLGKDETNFFYLFTLYFKGPFFGSYQIIKAFLFSLIFFFGGAVVVSTIGSTIIEIAHPEIITDILNLYENSDPLTFAEAFEDFILNNEFFSIITEIAVYASFGAAFIYFVHASLKNGFKCYMNLLSKVPMPAHDLNIISKETMKIIKRVFNKDYYKSLWYVIILFVAGYIGGCFTARCLLNVSPDQVLVVGMFGSLLLTFGFIPYYFDVTYYLFRKHSDKFNAMFVKLSLETLEEVKKTSKIDPEKEEELRKYLDAQKKDIEEFLKEEKDKEDKRKNHD